MERNKKEIVNELAKILASEQFYCFEGTETCKKCKYYKINNCNSKKLADISLTFLLQYIETKMKNKKRRI